MAYKIYTSYRIAQDICEVNELVKQGFEFVEVIYTPVVEDLYYHSHYNPMTQKSSYEGLNISTLVSRPNYLMGCKPLSEVLYGKAPE